MSSIPPPQVPGVQTPRPRGRSRRRWLTALAFAVLVAVAGWFIPTNTYAISPGSATPLAGAVKAKPTDGQPAPAAPAKGSAYMADVYVTSLNVDRWLLANAFSRNTDFVSSEQLLGPGGDEAQLAAQGYVQMADSKDAARVAAFRELGLSVSARPNGARIDEVSVTGAAHGKLSAGDRVVAVGPTAVRGSCGLIRAIHDSRPGTTVTLSVAKARFSDVGTLSYAKPGPVKVTLGQPRARATASRCPGVSGLPGATLGVTVSTSVRYRWPVDVSIRTDLVGGPSAGLAMTLQLLDELSGGKVLEGRRIAATGTMDPAGQVGDVGGVRQKAVAVRQAGLELFLVPKGEGAAAEAGAPSGLKVAEVSTLAQALRVLKVHLPLSLSPAWARAVA